MAFVKIFTKTNESSLNDKLRKVDSDLLEITSQLNSTSEKLDQKSKDITALKKEILLKQEKIELTYFQIDEYNDEIEKNNSQKLILEQNLQEVSSKLLSSETQLGQKSSDSTELQQLVNQIKIEIANCISKKECFDLEYSEKNDEIKNLQTSLKDLKNQLKEQEKSLEDLYLTKNSKEAAIEKFSKELAETKEKFEVKKAEITKLNGLILQEDKIHEDLFIKSDLLNKEQEEQQQKIANLKSELIRAEDKRKKLESHIQLLRDDLSQSQNTFNDIKNSVDDKTADNRKKEAELASYEKRFEDERLLLNELFSKERELKKKENELHEKIELITSQILEKESKTSDYKEKMSELEIDLAGLMAEFSYKEQEFNRIQSNEISLTRKIDQKTQESQDLQTELKRLSVEIQNSNKETESKRSSLLKIEASIQSMKEQLKVQYESFENYTERRKSSEEDLNLAQIKQNSLSEEMARVYRSWSEEKSTYEDTERKLTVIIGDCNSLSQKINSLNEDRNSLQKETIDGQQEIVRKTQKHELLSEELSRLTIESNRLREDLKSFKQKELSLNEELSTLSASVAKLDDLKNSLETECADLTKNNNQLLVKLESKTELHTNTLSKINYSKERIVQLDILNAQKNQEITSFNERIAELDRELIVLDQNKKVLDTNLASHNLQFEKVKEVYDETLKNHIYFQKSIDTALVELESLKVEIEKKNKETESVSTKIQLLKKQEIYLNNEKEKVILELGKTNEEHARYAALLEDLSNKLDHSQQEVQKKSELNSSLLEAMTILRLKLKNIENELISTQVLQKEKERESDKISFEKEELEKSSLSLIQQVEKNKAKISKLNTDIDSGTAENLVLTERIKKATKEISILENEINVKQEQDSEIEKNNYGLVSSVNELERQKSVLQSRFKRLSEKESEVVNLKKVFDSEKLTLIDSINSLTANLQMIEITNKKTQTQNEADLQELKELRKKHLELTSEIQKKKNVILSLGNDTSSINNERTRLKKKIAEYGSIEKNVNYEQERMTREKEFTENEILALRARVKDLEGILENKKNKNSELERSYSSLDKEKNDLHLKHQSLMTQIKGLDTRQAGARGTNQSLELIGKLENLVARITFNADVVSRQINDNECTREFLTSFYTNVPKIAEYFDSMDSVVIDCGARSGRVEIKGQLKKLPPELLTSPRLSKELSALFRYLKVASISGIKFENSVMTIGYHNQILDVQNSN